jgi:hypothetical protein
MKKLILGLIFANGSMFAMDTTNVIEMAIQKTVIEVTVGKQCSYQKTLSMPMPSSEKEKQKEFSFVAISPPFYFLGGVYDCLDEEFDLRSSHH